MKQLFLASFLLLSVPTLAQTTARLTPYIRAGIGVSRAFAENGPLSNFIYTNNPGVAPSPAVAAELGGDRWLFVANLGLGVNVPIGKHLGLQAEVNLEQKGSVAVSAEGIYSVSVWYAGSYVRQPLDGRFTTRLTYLTVPVLVSCRIGKLALSVGPYVGRKIGQKQTGQYTLAGMSDSRPIEPNRLGGYRATDAGVIAGLVYAVTPRMAVDVRYSQSLRAVTDYYYEGYVDSPGVATLRNQSAQLALRYYLRR